MKRKVMEAERGRWSAKAKRELVLRLWRGEDLDALSREVKLPAARLSQWRDVFLASVSRAFRPASPDARDEKVAQLKETLGEMTMRCEL